MTDEEKAIDYATTECCNSCTSTCKKEKCAMFCNVRNAVLYGLAESKAREQALAERVLQLQSDKGKLIDENRKMRCCENCKHNGSDSEIGENGNDWV